MNENVAVVGVLPDRFEIMGDRVNSLSDIQIKFRSGELEGTHIQKALTVDGNCDVEMRSDEDEVVVEVLVEEAGGLEVGGVVDHGLGDVVSFLV